MSLLDLDKAIQPIQYVNKRQLCETYEGAYEYFCDRVDEMEKASNYPWVQQDKKTKKWSVRVTLYAMPLYWKYEEMLDSNGGTTEVDVMQPDDNGKLTKLKTVTKMLGYTQYEVDDYKAGVELLHALRNTEDETFKEILTRASNQMKEVREVELKNINKYAKHLYNASKWSEGTMGEWSHKDGLSKANTPAFSKEKTNKMNQYKQMARRQLGYERAKVSVEIRGS